MGITWVCIIMASCLPVFSLGRYALLNDGDVTATNITDTTVLLIWKSIDIPKDTNLLNDYRLIISYHRTGYNPIYMEAKNYDPECSLTLSQCRLTGLAPESVYSVRLTIDTTSNTENATLTGSAELTFSTLATPTTDWQWWLLYVGLPCAGGLIVIIIIVIILCARCCGCCCWKKRAKANISSSGSMSSSKYCSRPESQATREWVQTTVRNIENDPPSTYDQPQIYPTTSPRSPNSNHTYLPMSETSVPKYITPIEFEDDSYPPMQDSSSRTNDYLQPVSSSPRTHHNMIQLPLPSGKPKLRPANPQPVGGAAQKEKGCPIYTNTEDVDKLLGNARKMFPSLSS